MHNIFSSYSPVAAIENIEAWAEVRHPLHGRQMQPVTLQVARLRTSESRVIMSHGNCEVASYGTFVDAGKPLSSIDSAIDRALSVAREFSVGPESSALIEIEVKIVDSPAMAPTTPDLLRSHERHARGASRSRDWLQIPENIRLRKPSPWEDGAFTWPAIGADWTSFEGSVPVLGSILLIDALKRGLMEQFFKQDLQIPGLALAEAA